MNTRSWRRPVAVVAVIAGLVTVNCENATRRSALRAFDEIEAKGLTSDERAVALEKFVERYPAHETNPRLVDAFWHIGLHHARAGRVPIASTWFERAVAKAPDDPGLLNVLGYHYARNGIALDRAIALLERAVSLGEAREYPPNQMAFFHDSLGWAHFARGDAAIAVPFLEGAASLSPDVPIIREHLAEVLRAIDRSEEAIDLYLELYAAGDPSASRVAPALERIEREERSYGRGETADRIAAALRGETR